MKNKIRQICEKEKKVFLSKKSILPKKIFMILTPQRQTMKYQFPDLLLFIAHTKIFLIFKRHKNLHPKNYFLSAATTAVAMTQCLMIFYNK